MHAFARGLLDQITLVHGPLGMLRDYFEEVEAAIRDRGLRLRFRTDFDHLVELNRQHADSWPALMPIFHPGHSALRIDNAFWLEAIDGDGETVATHSARLFDWHETNLAEEMRSLRIFFADPKPHRAAGDWVEIDAPAAARIRGRTMAGGSVWVRPDCRRWGLASIVPKISRAYALTRWNIDYNWAVMEGKTHAMGLSRSNGFHVEAKVVTRLKAWRDDLTVLFLWMSRDDILADMRATLDHATVESARLIEMQNSSMSPEGSRHGMSSRS
jgi:GNAT superfamily N-acetyltransferase